MPFPCRDKKASIHRTFSFFFRPALFYIVPYRVISFVVPPPLNLSDEVKKYKIFPSPIGLSIFLLRLRLLFMFVSFRSVCLSRASEGIELQFHVFIFPLGWLEKSAILEDEAATCSGIESSDTPLPGNGTERGRICFQFIIVISMEVLWRGALRFGRKSSY